MSARKTLIGFCAVFLLASSVWAQEADNRARAETLESEAIVKARQNELDSAIETIKQAIEADSTYEAAHTRLGYFLLKKNDLDGAMKSFEEALKQRPASHSAKTGKGIVLARKGDFKTAEEVLKNALVLNPDPVRTHYELGKVYEQLGDSEKAIAEFKEGIKKFREGRK